MDDYAVQLQTLPAEPLIGYLREAMRTQTRHVLFTRCQMSAGSFDKLLHQKRVTFLMADRVCIRLGLHPAMFWPEEWVAMWEPKYKDSRTLSHCAEGHPMTIDHAYMQPNGGRRCRTCQNAYLARRRAA